MVSEGGLELPRRLRGLCDCLRLQEEHEATQEEDNQHEWREGKCKEGNQQVEEPENESAHAVDLRGCLEEYSTIHAGGYRIETLRPPGGLVCKRPGKVSPGEGRSGEVRPAEVHIGEPHPEEVRPAGVGPGEVRPWFDRVTVDFHIVNINLACDIPTSRTVRKTCSKITPAATGMWSPPLRRESNGRRKQVPTVAHV